MTDKKNTVSASDTQSSSNNDKTETSSSSDVQSSAMPSEKKSSTVARSQSPKQTKKTDSSASTVSKKTSSNAQSTTTKPVTTSSTSKTGVFAILLSLIAIAGVGGHYYWQTEQHKKLVSDLHQQNKALQTASQQKLLGQINQQQNALVSDVTTSVQALLTDSEQQLQALQQQVTSLGQNKASDWLIHEAEYLIRVASRSLWLEKDTTAAIGLLKDADARLAELKDPSFLPVRQLINQDIEQLRLQPTLQTEETILTLMAMAEQIKQLPIAMAYLPEAEEAGTDLELSESTDDWRQNLAKSWQRFLNDFITVRRRTANVEALLSPKQQQNLRDNLQLKLQLAQWAASQHKSNIYQQSLTEAQRWLTEYFDTDSNAVTQFTHQLSTLKNATIALDLPGQLSSLQPIKAQLNQSNTLSETINAPIDNSEEDKAQSNTPKPVVENDATKQEEGNSQNEGATL